jgi:RHS repeat-associated protein
VNVFERFRADCRQKVEKSMPMPVDCLAWTKRKSKKIKLYMVICLPPFGVLTMYDLCFLRMQFQLALPASQAFSFDANGNMTNVATGVYPQYSYDAENRLILIKNNPTTSSNISYDAAGHFCQIVETQNGVVQSTNNLVWCGDELCEARLADGSPWAQYFSFGEVSFSGGTNKFFYSKDHLGSTHEFTDNSGNILGRFSYDPWGVPTLTQGYLTPTFGYAGYYEHGPSGLNLAVRRAYNPTQGRWINRDPIGEQGGINLYRYVLNIPVSLVDPSGLQQTAPGGGNIPGPVPGTGTGNAPINGGANPIAGGTVPGAGSNGGYFNPLVGDPTKGIPPIEGANPDPGVDLIIPSCIVGGGYLGWKCCLKRLENALNDLGSAPLQSPGSEVTNIENQIDEYHDLMRRIFESLRFK